MKKKILVFKLKLVHSAEASKVLKKKILRKSVYSYYLKKYEQASKMLKAAYVNYNKLVGSFIETLNLCNCGNNSYWGNNPEKIF